MISPAATAWDSPIPAQAATILGFEIVKSMVLFADVVSQSTASGEAGPLLNSLTRHSLDVAAKAKAIATGFLIEQVGDLLRPGTFRLHADSRWVADIEASRLPHGRIGVVGRIAVDAETGEVYFSDDDRAEVRERAQELALASPL